MSHTLGPAQCDDFPQEAHNFFESRILAPLREAVFELDNIARRMGMRYAWEIAASDRIQNTWNNIHTPRILGTFARACETRGLSGYAFARSSKELLALETALARYTRWGDTSANAPSEFLGPACPPE